MKLNVVNENSKSKKVTKSTVKKVDVLDVFKELNPAIKKGVKVCLNAEGKKQNDKLTSFYYIVEEVYLASLGDMKVWMIRLEKIDNNVMNPYIANHFKIYKENES